MNTGVYKIFNKLTGDFYIGSSSRSFKHRFYQHKNYLKNGKHRNPHLQNSWNKHGESNFEFVILATCPKEYCIKLEQWFLDTLKPQYNLRERAESNLGVRFSEEHKRKLSESQKGRPLTEEHKAKLKLAKLNENKAARGRALSKALAGRILGEASRIANRDKRRLHKSVAKLNPEDVYEIKWLLSRGSSVQYCAEIFKSKVSISTIRDIRSGRTWQDIKLMGNE